MLQRFLPKNIKRRVARFLFFIIIYQIVYPVRVFALTSGPSQPEMQSFEPIGTTDLVDPFTGDFNYNIPLLDIDGYPINIAYHSGVTMDQEASWVGLGWNINPGNINHNVRGLSDDLNGDLISRTVKINNEKKKSFGLQVGNEVLGRDIGKNAKGSLMTSLNLGMHFSNYTGLSADFRLGLTPNASGNRNDELKSKPKSWISGGVNLGLGASTSDGANFDYGFSLAYHSKATNGHQNSITGNFGQQFNSRQGLMNTSFGLNPSVQKGKDEKESRRNNILYHNINSYLGLNSSWTPIGLSNFVPVITNASTMIGLNYQLKVGNEVKGIYKFGGISVDFSEISIEENGDSKGYGYLNSQNANEADMLDFTRDRDGRFNRKMHYLPCGNMTYDIFSASGHGTSGSFRAFRNDIGQVYDPYISSSNKKLSVLVEIGTGDLSEIGADIHGTVTSSNSGPWTKFNSPKRRFMPKGMNNLYEPYYFKQAGELTQTNEDYAAVLPNDQFVDNNVGQFHYVQAKNLDQTPIVLNTLNKRVPRSNLFYFNNAKEASSKNVSLMPKLESYPIQGNILQKDFHPRIINYRKPNQISEITQLLPDGRRYVYGIPAMNIDQKEYVFSVNSSSLYSFNSSQPMNSAVSHTNIENAYSSAGSNPDWQELNQEYHMKTVNPSHAHSYLLSSILSEDYSDLTGDGITDDDLGNFTKFNYTLKSNTYEWRSPYSADSAKLNIGVRSDGHDDKGTVVKGKKEIWMLHSIESKNYVAEFFISARLDGAGARTTPGGAISGSSYKLDKIVLYSKRDRIHETDNAGVITKTLNASAKPIKEVLFTYDYSLCKGVPNKITTGTSDNPGKLTLKAISIRNGNSDIGLLSPYRFKYSNKNPDYYEQGSDMWGSYKKGTGSLRMNNQEFPYVDQLSATANEDASAWNLEEISLPSGGTIKVSYESDDYAYVQDKRAMEMFKVEGMGFSPTYAPGNLLYASKTSPALYLYFRRKAIEPFGSGANFAKNYLDGLGTIMYNFEVKLHGGSTASCPNVPLVDNIKGYADISEIGMCTDAQYGYIKLKPKEATAEGKLCKPGNGEVFYNPIMISAIHYAQYYNNRALAPASEIISSNVLAILKQLAISLKEYANFVRSPFISFINQNVAKEFNIGRSYIRLQSQGFKKGGGHRVASVEFSDQWKTMVGSKEYSIYGSKYDYTKIDPVFNQKVSSGVASYEPIGAGDENPFRNQVHTDRIGNEAKFPLVDPIELIVEEPLGESLFPPASVGYSQVQITSLHKSEGESSQLVQQSEFYTAKDFPVNVSNTSIEEIENQEPGAFNMARIKKDIFKVGQSYLVSLNDMHGKLKATRTFVDKKGLLEEVSHVYYEFQTKTNPLTGKLDLDNKVNCINIDNSNPLVIAQKEIGVEEDFTYDTREKNESTRTYGVDLSSNFFSIGLIPILLALPSKLVPKGNEKTFSSIVTTKIVQKYGILKTIETFDKGATMSVTNELYDSKTGQVLLSRTNTEFKDKEYDLKTPAYWAYNSMGPAYENIHYTHKIGNQVNDAKASIVNDRCFIYLTEAQLKRFNIGDELEIEINHSCSATNNTIYYNKPDKYKLWVVDKGPKGINLSQSFKQQCNPTQPTCVPNPPNLNYTLIGEPFATGVNTTKTFCLSRDNVLDFLRMYLHDPVLSKTAANPVPIDQVLIKNEFNPIGACDKQIILPYGVDSRYDPSIPCNTTGIRNVSIKSVFQLRELQQNEVKSAKFTPVITDASQNSSKIGISDKLVKLVYEVTYSDEYYLSNIQLPAGFTSSELYYNYNSGAALVTAANTRDAMNSSDIINSIDKDARDPLGFLNLSSQHPIYGTPPTITYSASPHLPTRVKAYPDNISDPYKVNKILAFTVTVYVPWDSYSGSPAPDPWNSIGGFPKTFKYFSDYHTSNLTCPTNTACNEYQHSFTGAKVARVNCYDIVRKERSIIDRSELDDKNNSNCIVALPMKRNAVASDLSEDMSIHRWPSNDTIYDAKIKVIRSGKRNNLRENVQQVAMLNNPASAPSLATSYQNVLSISATEYTDETLLPDELNDPATVFFNPYLLGAKGTQRPFKMYVNQKARMYNNPIDKDKGMVQAVSSYWGTPASSSSPLKYNKFLPHPNPSSAKWYPKTTVTKYGPWGNDLEIQDASGNFHCNLFGYGNRLPISIVANSESDNCLNENFEDYGAVYNYFINYMPNSSLPIATPLPSSYRLPVDQNQLKGFLKNPLSSSYFDFVNSAHTGTQALHINAPVSLSIPVNMGNMVSAFNKPTLFPFYFRNQTKYVFSYWQQVFENGTIPSTGKAKVSYNGVNYVAKPKSANIDGWVLYEGVIDIGPNVVGVNSANILLESGATLDDIRILPDKSNMKSYVYNSINQKLVAVLDENNTATFFEYGLEGKLLRIKKETDKGRLTLKESRESLYNIIAPSGSTILVDQSALFPMTATSIFNTVLAPPVNSSY